MGSGVVNGVIYRESMYIRVWFVERVCAWKLDEWDRVGDEPSFYGERLDRERAVCGQRDEIVMGK